jgi:hypothetical protein
MIQPLSFPKHASIRFSDATFGVAMALLVRLRDDSSCDGGGAPGEFRQALAEIPALCPEFRRAGAGLHTSQLERAENADWSHVNLWLLHLCGSFAYCAGLNRRRRLVDYE